MDSKGMNRRQFLHTSGAAAAGVAAVGAGATIIAPDGAWAMETKAIDRHAAMTLLRMARHICPHDFLGDQYYAVAVEALDAQAAGSDDTRKLLMDGVASLDNALGIKWLDLSEGYQVSVLKSIETSGFFTTVRGATIGNLYNNPLVMRYFGDEGSSVEFGGYIDRGFDDIGWLPKV